MKLESKTLIAKDSDIPWLGEIPEHWVLKKLKYIARLKSGENIKSEMIKQEDLFPVYGGNGLRGYFYEYTHDGDYVLIGRQGALCGNINYAKGKFWASEHAIVVSPRVQCETIWLGELLRSMNLNQYSVSAAQPGLSVESISQLQIPFPPLIDQKSIARFLDRKTAAIDTLIAKKQRLIQLLEEKRTALINQAVTKGLNPNAPMKDSGIPWIGEIPENWEVKKLKWLCPYIMVGIVVTPAKYYVEFGIPCLRSLNIKSGKIIEENLVYISEESNEILSKSKIFVGDLVCVRTGQPGTTAVVDERFNGINCIDLIIIRKSARASSDYISLMMNSEVCRSQYSMGTSGSIQQHFNVETATNLIICNPPLDEQLRIVERCQKIIEKHQILIQKVSDQIEKLQEYRRSLITAAVTGKLDIHNLNQET